MMNRLTMYDSILEENLMAQNQKRKANPPYADTGNVPGSLIILIRLPSEIKSMYVDLKFAKPLHNKAPGPTFRMVGGGLVLAAFRK